MRRILAIAFLLACPSVWAGFVGYYPAGATVECDITTVNASGPTALAGTPTVTVYKDHGTSTSTSGVTLTTSRNSVTGYNHVAFDLSSDGTYYATGHYFDAIVSAGTVGGVSVVGYDVCSWQIGVVPANVTQVGGTTQTARDLGASVLLSSGTGTGQVLLSSGTVTAGTVSDKTGYSLTQAFPSNFSSLGIGASGHITNVDTLTTYTGNTPQTGDAFARLGAPVGASISADIAGVPTANWAAGTRTLTACSFCLTATQVENAVLDGALSSHTTAGSAGKALGYLTGAVPTVASIWDEPQSGHTTSGTFGKYLDAQLSLIKLQTDLISSGSITIRPPVSLDGVVEIVAGDSYLSADGRSISFSVGSKNWPTDLTGWTITITAIDGAGSTVLTDTLTVTTPTGSSRAVLWQPTATKTAVTSGAYRFEIRAVSGSSVARLELGTLRVRAGTT